MFPESAALTHTPPHLPWELVRNAHCGAHPMPAESGPLFGGGVVSIRAFTDPPDSSNIAPSKKLCLRDEVRDSCPRPLVPRSTKMGLKKGCAFQPVLSFFLQRNRAHMRLRSPPEVRLSPRAQPHSPCLVPGSPGSTSPLPHLACGFSLHHLCRVWLLTWAPRRGTGNQTLTTAMNCALPLSLTPSFLPQKNKSTTVQAIMCHLLTTMSPTLTLCHNYLFLQYTLTCTGEIRAPSCPEGTPLLKCVGI